MSKFYLSEIVVDLDSGEGYLLITKAGSPVARPGDKYTTEEFRKRGLFCLVTCPDDEYPLKEFLHENGIGYSFYDTEVYVKKDDEVYTNPHFPEGNELFQEMEKESALIRGFMKLDVDFPAKDIDDNTFPDELLLDKGVDGHFILMFRKLKNKEFAPPEENSAMETV